MKGGLAGGALLAYWRGNVRERRQSLQVKCLQSRLSCHGLSEADNAGRYSALPVQFIQVAHHFVVGQSFIRRSAGGDREDRAARLYTPDLF